jgi:hypothetical protein
MIGRVRDATPIGTPPPAVLAWTWLIPVQLLAQHHVNSIRLIMHRLLHYMHLVLIRASCGWGPRINGRLGIA